MVNVDALRRTMSRVGACVDAWTLQAAQALVCGLDETLLFPEALRRSSLIAMRRSLIMDAAPSRREEEDPRVGSAALLVSSNSVEGVVGGCQQGEDRSVDVDCKNALVVADIEYVDGHVVPATAEVCSGASLIRDPSEGALSPEQWILENDLHGPPIQIEEPAASLNAERPTSSATSMPADNIGYAQNSPSDPMTTSWMAQLDENGADNTSREERRATCGEPAGMKSAHQDMCGSDDAPQIDCASSICGGSSFQVNQTRTSFISDVEVASEVDTPPNARTVREDHTFVGQVASEMQASVDVISKNSVFVDDKDIRSSHPGEAGNVDCEDTFVASVGEEILNAEIKDAKATSASAEVNSSRLTGGPFEGAMSSEQWIPEKGLQGPRIQIVHQPTCLNVEYSPSSGDAMAEDNIGDAQRSPFGRVPSGQMEQVDETNARVMDQEKLRARTERNNERDTAPNDRIVSKLATRAVPPSNTNHLCRPISGKADTVILSSKSSASMELCMVKPVIQDFYIDANEDEQQSWQHRERDCSHSQKEISFAASATAHQDVHVSRGEPAGMKSAHQDMCGSDDAPQIDCASSICGGSSFQVNQTRTSFISDVEVASEVDTPPNARTVREDHTFVGQVASEMQASVDVTSWNGSFSDVEDERVSANPTLLSRRSSHTLHAESVEVPADLLAALIEVDTMAFVPPSNSDIASYPADPPADQEIVIDCAIADYDAKLDIMNAGGCKLRDGKMEIEVAGVVQERIGSVDAKGSVENCSILATANGILDSECFLGASEDIRATEDLRRSLILLSEDKTTQAVGLTNSIPKSRLGSLRLGLSEEKNIYQINPNIHHTVDGASENCDGLTSLQIVLERGQGNAECTTSSTTAPAGLRNSCVFGDHPVNFRSLPHEDTFESISFMDGVDDKNHTIITRLSSVGPNPAYTDGKATVSDEHRTVVAMTVSEQGLTDSSCVLSTQPVPEVSLVTGDTSSVNAFPAMAFSGILEHDIIHGKPTATVDHHQQLCQTSRANKAALTIPDDVQTGEDGESHSQDTIPATEVRIPPDIQLDEEHKTTRLDVTRVFDASSQILRSDHTVHNSHVSIDEAITHLDEPESVLSARRGIVSRIVRAWPINKNRGSGRKSEQQLNTKNRDIPSTYGSFKPTTESEEICNGTTEDKNIYVSPQDMHSVTTGTTSHVELQRRSLRTGNHVQIEPNEVDTVGGPATTSLLAQKLVHADGFSTFASQADEQSTQDLKTTHKGDSAHDEERSGFIPCHVEASTHELSYVRGLVRADPEESMCSATLEDMDDLNDIAETRVQPVLHDTQCGTNLSETTNCVPESESNENADGHSPENCRDNDPSPAVSTVARLSKAIHSVEGNSQTTFHDEPVATSKVQLSQDYPTTVIYTRAPPMSADAPCVNLPSAVYTPQKIVTGDGEPLCTSSDLLDVNVMQDVREDESSVCRDLNEPLTPQQLGMNRKTGYSRCTPSEADILVDQRWSECMSIDDLSESGALSGDGSSECLSLDCSSFDSDESWNGVDHESDDSLSFGSMNSDPLGDDVNLSAIEGKHMDSSVIITVHPEHGLATKNFDASMPFDLPAKIMPSSVECDRITYRSVLSFNHSHHTHLMPAMEFTQDFSSNQQSSLNYGVVELGSRAEDQYYSLDREKTCGHHPDRHRSQRRLSIERTSTSDSIEKDEGEMRTEESTDWALWVSDSARFTSEPQSRSDSAPRSFSHIASHWMWVMVDGVLQLLLAIKGRFTTTRH